MWETSMPAVGKCVLTGRTSILFQTENLAKLRPVFLSTFFLYFTVTSNSDSKKKIRKHCDFRCNIPFKSRYLERI